ncbi:hypothetical protein ACTI_43500 [Actinoplanes sp. OR16]|nr:hypothetical protein ACTI_43500 [Actinoplanes sp. OR16]
MHEIEDLVHGSIVVLDKHFPADDDRLPGWFARLYEFQSAFDCSDTRGRVRDILIRRGHGQPARPVRLIDVVAAVAEAAEADGDIELIALWHGLGYDVLELVDPMDSPGAARLREIVARTDAVSVELPYGYRPSDQDLDTMDDELETWWYRVRD